MGEGCVKPESVVTRTSSDAMLQDMTAQSGGTVSNLPIRPTLREVAARADVALSTASRVLNNGSASPELRERVLAAAEAVGYRPHALARSLRTGATRTVAFLVPDIANPLFGYIARGAAARFGAAGYSMLLAISDGRPERERSLIETMASRQVDGFLLSCTDEADAGLIELLSSMRVPIVLLDRELPVSGAHRVLIEHRRGLIEAVAHLAELGHRRIAYIGGDTIVRPGRERLAGYLAGMAQHLSTAEPAVRLGSSGHEFGRREALRLFADTTPPTAIISGGNQISTGVLQAVREAGKDIPSDLSFVGCDDIDALVLNNPPMTVVSRSVEEIGSEAADLLLGALRGEVTEPTTRVIHSRLVVRGSTRRPTDAPGSTR
ncbi:MAG: LacI family DNA-binding transcriptional regulator [Chloroflexi bacterium]|nr:LacI family DNA-binding transcriptional regulator [Chloroflexota bacterium]